MFNMLNGNRVWSARVLATDVTEAASVHREWEARGVAALFRGVHSDYIKHIRDNPVCCAV